METLHSLLLRQLRKCHLQTGEVPDAAAFEKLLGLVTRAYSDVDQERYLLERSQTIASQEMADLNRQLKQSRERMQNLLSLSSDWVWEQDVEGRFTFASEELEYRNGLPARTLLQHACSVDGPLRMAAADLAHMHELMANWQPFFDMIFEVKSAKDELQYMRITGEPVFEDAAFKGYRGVGSDVTALVLADRRIQELARFDSLTKLPNRYMYMEELHNAVVIGKRQQSGCAVLFIDLDGFKAVNDNLGHAAGDALLCTVASRLRELAAAYDIVGRLGGDEFVILVRSSVSASEMTQLAERIVETIAEPIKLEGMQVQVSASIGISLFPHDGDDATSLLRAADHAMYQSKARGKNTHTFFGTPR